MSMEPDQIAIEDGILYLTVGEEGLNQAMLQQLSQRLVEVIQSSQIKIVVADTRQLTSRVPEDVDRALIEMVKVLPQYIDKYVAICYNAVAKLETNYVFKQVGVDDRFRAFRPEDQHEAIQFCGQPIRLFR